MEPERARTERMQTLDIHDNIPYPLRRLILVRHYPYADHAPHLISHPSPLYHIHSHFNAPAIIPAILPGG